MECLLEVKIHCNYGDFIKRAKKYIAIPINARYIIFFFTIYAIIHIIIGIVFNLQSILMMILIFSPLIYGIYFYYVNNNTKKLLDLYGKATIHYCLKFYNEYLEVYDKEKKVVRFNYDVFKIIAQTNMEYILFTDDNRYCIVPKNITETEKEVFFKITNKQMKIKKISKID